MPKLAKKSLFSQIKSAKAKVYFQCTQFKLPHNYFAGHFKILNYLRLNDLIMLKYD